MAKVERRIKILKPPFVDLSLLQTTNGAADRIQAKISEPARYRGKLLNTFEVNRVVAPRIVPRSSGSMISLLMRPLPTSPAVGNLKRPA